MKYFKSKLHFSNYAKVILNERNITLSDISLLECAYELTKITAGSLAICKIIKTSSNVESELSDYINSGFKFSYGDKGGIMLKIPMNRSGVYFIYDCNDLLLYVGKSINLGNRVIDSFIDKISYIPCYVKYMDIPNKSDMMILEQYYISILNPTANKAGVYECEPTIKLKHNYKYSDIILPTFTDDFPLHKKNEALVKSSVDCYAKK